MARTETWNQTESSQIKRDQTWSKTTFWRLDVLEIMRSGMKWFSLCPYGRSKLWHSSWTELPFVMSWALVEQLHMNSCLTKLWKARLNFIFMISGFSWVNCELCVFLVELIQIWFGLMIQTLMIDLIWLIHYESPINHPLNHPLNHHLMWKSHEMPHVSQLSSARRRWSRAVANMATTWDALLSVASGPWGHEEIGNGIVVSWCFNGG